MYLEIERTMNTSFNAINSLIEFADFYLLERSNIEQRIIFFLILMHSRNTCAHLVSFTSFLANDTAKHIRSIITLQLHLCHALCVQFRPTFSEE